MLVLLKNISDFLLACNFSKHKHWANINRPGTAVHLGLVTHRKAFLCFKELTSLFSLYFFTSSTIDFFLSFFLSWRPSSGHGTLKSIRNGSGLDLCGWVGEATFLKLLFKSLEIWNWWQLVKFSMFGNQPVSWALGIALFSSLRFGLEAPKKLVKGREMNNCFSVTHDSQ